MMPHSWKSIVVQSAPFLVLTCFLSIISGFLIETAVGLLTTYPIVLVMIPIFIDSCGGISASFAGRLTSYLNLGLANFKRRRGQIMTNIKVTLAINVVFFLIISILVYLTSLLLSIGSPPFLPFLFSVLASSFVNMSISITLSISMARTAIRRNLDPDNFESPLLFTFNDLIGVFIFISICGLILI